ncbi:hypothetical protein [Fibrella forsythiae]|uniref:Uncharacterized protein n=1 Tax=Fibrella forsythiae TaxID=2817061 RepID=A0ABS3JHL8_9BACT|nr:hypothetical protein [Fibrella forsythiae]MBO0949460.1 hypothetical protein [Fibrella forsythiae]
MTYVPTSHLVSFVIDNERGRYIVQNCEPGFTRVPRELIVEDRRFNDDINANLILRGTATEKKTGGRSVKFFTGLQPTNEANVFLGNVLTFGRNGERIRNGVVVRFTADAGCMTLRYFPTFYPYPDARAAFVSELIRRGLL